MICSEQSTCRYMHMEKPSIFYVRNTEHEIEVDWKKERRNWNWQRFKKLKVKFLGKKKGWMTRYIENIFIPAYNGHGIKNESIKQNRNEQKRVWKDQRESHRDLVEIDLEWSVLRPILVDWKMFFKKEKMSWSSRPPFALSEEKSVYILHLSRTYKVRYYLKKYQ